MDIISKKQTAQKNTPIKENTYDKNGHGNVVFKRLFSLSKSETMVDIFLILCDWLFAITALTCDIVQVS